MALLEKNLETVLRLLVAHQQRYQELQEIAARLLQPNFYRSPDGSLSAGAFTPAEREQLLQRINDLLDEAGVIANNVRQMVDL